MLSKLNHAWVSEERFDFLICDHYVILWEHRQATQQFTLEPCILKRFSVIFFPLKLHDKSLNDLNEVEQAVANRDVRIKRFDCVLDTQLEIADYDSRLPIYVVSLKDVLSQVLQDCRVETCMFTGEKCIGASVEMVDII